MSKQLKAEVAVIALNKMLRGGHFSICTVTEVAELYNVNAAAMRKTDAFKMLNNLHCVDFNVMTPRVRESIPELIKACLAAEAPEVFQFAMPDTRPKRESVTDMVVIDVEYAEVREPRREAPRNEPTPEAKKGGIRFRLPWSRE